MHMSIALWSHPRSMSTALERSFAERGDFRIFHEAFSYAYYMSEDGVPIPYKHPDPTHPRTYSEIKQMMERARTEQPVFHKDFPYHAIDRLLADPDYLRGQVNTFLIRDPEDAVRSHLTVHPGATREVLGYEQLSRLFDAVSELTGAVPLVIDAGDLADDPRGTLAAYCDLVGIPFRPEALRWGSGERPEWSTWKEWHVDVARSDGFRRPARRYRPAVDPARVTAYVDHCRPYYARLRAFRIRPHQLLTKRK